MKTLACLAVLALAACGEDDSAARSDRAIEGTVRDEFTQRGIAGAKIRFVSDTLDEAETTSESDGRYTIDVEVFEGVKFGTIEATHADYAEGKKHSVYFDGSALKADLELRPKK